MRSLLKMRFVYFSLLFITFISGISVHAQEEEEEEIEKNSVGLTIQYVKIMGGDLYFDVKATSKIDKQFVKVSNIDLFFFNDIDDERIKLGKITTNTSGKGRFSVKNIKSLKADAENIYNISIDFLGNKQFEETTEYVSFKDAEIKASLYNEDSINYVTATLTDPVTGLPIIEAYLDVQIQRMFKPLKMGEEFNITDESGTVIVPIDQGIPGLNGELTIEVVLNESEEYGTIKSIITAPIGKQIVDESTFDERTMWSPRNKTPLFLLIFPNLLIFGIWGLIIYLIRNLFKITKS
ncbi:hypothetical protein [Lutibacter sp.]|uniref:hypothetical protein n=1 Tax=Lutibacter sp. TaxID=1925666 RepID=UPI0027350C26|nr:hypothetical protein [Lutibacter sp.]MDP3312408.1 hypothetical protein [Lutibacter sp.]